MERFARGLFACVLLLAAAPASAQPAPPTRVQARAIEFASGRVARLTCTWGSETETGIAIDPGDGNARSIHRGAAAGTLVAGHGLVILAYEVDDRRPFRVRVARPTNGVLVPGEVTTIARPSERRDFPFAVAGTATPDGFSIFFQEVQGDDPSAAHTYLVQLDREGAVRGEPREVRVPWSLAAAIWNGHGYHLALLFPGYGGSGMRLSMVSLTEAGQPQQHPDWASAAGYIDDVQLVSVGTEIHALYRGGPGGERMLESDVSAIRGWGSEPPRARDHGPLAPTQTIVVDERGRPRAIAAR